jgi:3-phenylpropionate/trans-cinnamate dioxygenase ferredoxin reductase subunit
VERSGIVIVGGGQASSQLAASLRERGYSEKVTIVATEGSLPYQRPPLSKSFLKGDVTTQSLELRTEQFYTKNAIDILLSETATEICRKERSVQLQSGSAVSYDHLVLATGSNNRRLAVPGSDAEGIFYLRSIVDAEAIKAWLRPSMKVVVIGAGFVGSELACVLRDLGAAVVVLEASQRPMSRAISPEASRFLYREHEASGIEFELCVNVVSFHGTNVAGFNGAKRVTAVELSDGRRLSADMVLVGIGAAAGIELADNSGLAASNGIEVDEMLSTADEAVSAIGDCALFFSSAVDQLVRLESVQNAVDQAKALAATLSGSPTAYSAIPRFWSDQGKHRLQIAGLTLGYDLAITRGDAASGRFSVFCYRQDRLVGVESLNQTSDHMIARRLLASQVHILPEQANDLSFDLRSLVGGGQNLVKQARLPSDA